MLGAPCEASATVTIEPTASPLEPRLPTDHVKAQVAMPPPAQRQPWRLAPPRQHQQQQHYSGIGSTAARPIRIPTVTMHGKQNLMAGGTMRRGIQITVSKNKGAGSNLSNYGPTNNMAPHQNNTWPRNAADESGNGGLRRTRSAANNYHNAVPARSPLSIYGDRGFHSFTVCGAPGCELCARDGDFAGGAGVRKAEFFLNDGRAVRNADADSKPGRKLIPHACEHCRMPFIPRGPSQEDEGEGRYGEAEAAVSECGSSSSGGGVGGVGETTPSTPLGREGSGVVVLEGSLAGGSVASSPASSMAPREGEEEEEEEEDRPFSPLVGVRNRRPSFTSSSRSQESSSSSSSSRLGQGGVVVRSGGRGGAGQSTGESDERFLPDSFCSGECKMSYMLTNPAAVRRRKAAAQAQAAARAARAANIESKLRAMKISAAAQRAGGERPQQGRRLAGQGDASVAARARE